jgi:IMP dehydrogenase/GMP reductase
LPAEQKCVPATRTVRLRIAATTNAGKVSALAATVAEWDRAVAR